MQGPKWGYFQLMNWLVSFAFLVSLYICVSTYHRNLHEHTPGSRTPIPKFWFLVTSVLLA